jgi:hypothetical protein
MVVKLGFTFLRYKRKCRKAGKVFRRQLVRGGLPPDVARRLASTYEEALSIRRLVRDLGSTGGPASLLKMG